MAQRTPQIFGVGGNFFVDAWERPLLQLQLLSLTDAVEPRICYLGTAGGDHPADIDQFYSQLNRHRVRLTHLKLFEPHTDRFADWFLGHDIVYVGGGATRNLMTLWRDWGVIDALRTAWHAGVVLAGTSAGAICWFEGCITDSLPERLLPLSCTGFLRGSACTHYDSRPDRPGRFRHFLQNGDIPGPGIATDNHTALYYRGTQLHEVVTAKPGKQAYRLEVVDGMVTETPLPARLLG